jgi:D-3-phosphoglycerate dehydrogenase
LPRRAPPGHAIARNREESFVRADMLSLHMAFTPETRGIVTAAELARMEPTAVLVNTARAGLVAPGALAVAHAAGRPGFAALDIVDQEPVPPGTEPLIGMPNVLCTPHPGYSVAEAYAPLLGNAVEQILAYAAGRPIDLVSPA